MEYLPRIIESQLEELLQILPAVNLDGPRWVGKTTTARRFSSSELRLDDPAQSALLSSAGLGELPLENPVLVDEWQYYPPVWDQVRRSVDDDYSPGRFILTGSAQPAPEAKIHTGAGRIVNLTVRPMCLTERQLVEPKISFADLLEGADFKPAASEFTLKQYAAAIAHSGFPQMQFLPRRAQELQLASYVEQIYNRELAGQGAGVRSGGSLREWLTAYAAASSATTSYNALLGAATPGQSDKPSKTTTIAFRDYLHQIKVIEPLPAWLPTVPGLNRLGQAPKHQLCDPALAVTLLGLDEDSLLMPQNASLLGQLFESLVTLQVRVLAQACQARVSHLRLQGGLREIDLIVEGQHGKVLAIEVKLSSHINQADVKHLLWLRKKLGKTVTNLVVVTPGPAAYTREDGIHVIPLALLGK